MSRLKAELSEMLSTYEKQSGSNLTKEGSQPSSRLQIKFAFFKQEVAKTQRQMIIEIAQRIADNRTEIVVTKSLSASKIGSKYHVDLTFSNRDVSWAAKSSKIDRQVKYTIEPLPSLYHAKALFQESSSLKSQVYFGIQVKVILEDILGPLLTNNPVVGKLSCTSKAKIENQKKSDEFCFVSKTAGNFKTQLTDESDISQKKIKGGWLFDRAREANWMNLSCPKESPFSRHANLMVLATTHPLNHEFLLPPVVKHHL